MMQRGASFRTLHVCRHKCGNRYRKVRNEVCRKEERERLASAHDHHDVDDEKEEEDGEEAVSRGKEHRRRVWSAKDSVLILSSATQDQDEDRMRA